MQAIKDKMLRYRLMDEHVRLVRNGLYCEAQRILSLLQRGHVKLGFGDIDWTVEGILTQLGCHITITGKYYLATAYLYCQRVH